MYIIVIYIFIVYDTVIPYGTENKLFLFIYLITRAVVAAGEHLHVGLAVGPDGPAHRLRVAPVSWAAANRFLAHSQVPPAHLVHAESCETQSLMLIKWAT
jgi:hypothetical protein